MVGELSEDVRDRFADFLIAFSLRNPEALASALVDVSVTRGSVDREALRTALVSFVGLYADRPLSEVSFARLASELLRVVREQRLQLPREVSLVFKILIMIEGIAVRLDPRFDLTAVLAPYARRLVRERLSPPAVARRMARATADAGVCRWNCPHVCGKLSRPSTTAGSRYTCAPPSWSPSSRAPSESATGLSPESSPRR